MSTVEALRRPPAAAMVALAAPVWAVGVALLAAGLTGALAPLGVEGLPDPGAVTRVGLPLVQALRDV